jgi:hypothetical protein
MMKTSNSWTGEKGMRSPTARAVSARLTGKPPIKVVYEQWDVTYKNRSNEPSMIATAGVWVDLTELAELVIRAAGNKNRKSKDGALHVEVHYLTEVKGL